MNIIFGDTAKTLPDRYTLLELDTFKTEGTDTPVTAYCVVDVIPLGEFPLAAANKKIHQDLLEAYRNKHWNYCEQAIEQLTGKWNGELDTFYVDLLGRVTQYKENGVTDDWDGCIVKTGQ
jgi:hypothetical protein